VTDLSTSARPDLSPWLDTVVDGECLQVMRELPDRSVDMVLADLPYGTTRNKWDSVIDLEQLWAAYERIVKPDGAIVLTAAQPFTAVLTCSNLKLFKYEWIWSKTIGSGQLNVKRQPLRTHESVLVFYRKQPVYHQQLTPGTPYTAKRAAKSWDGRGYNGQRDHEAVNTGTRVPKSVLQFSNPRIKGGHPTQKPVPLFEYLVRTYTDPGDVVLDNVIGSGTTGVACIQSGRRFIGIEDDPQWIRRSRERIEQARRAAADQTAGEQAAA
jgi:site-specific DNA-methyltransferase (adenine-specific)